MKASKAVSLVFLMMFYCVVNTQPVKAAENSWATMAEMPTARSEFGVAVVNGKIYAIGGYGYSYLNINEEYDPATNTWATKKLMPTARGSFAIAVYQNKIYVMGGSIGFDWAKEESILCSFNEVYDPLTDTWETKTSMPTNRSQLNANVVNGKIYLIGGRTGGQYTTVSLNEVYDPSTDTWTTKEPIPYPVVEYASAVVDNKIYVIGGQDEFHPDVNVAFNQIYDPETDIWSYGASLPTAVWQAAAGATTGIMAPKRIYVIGGMPRHDADGTNITQVYNPENDTWTFGASMPTARCDLAVAVVNDVLYAIGGHPGFMVLPPNYAKNEQYTPFGYVAMNGPIIIRSDGKVDPGTAPIQRDGNVYTFTGDINIDSGDCGIEVDRDNIVIDGAGFTLQGTVAYISRGIDLSDRSNVTIKNMEIRNFMDGIYLVPSSNNTITQNNITANTGSGIWTAGVSNNITGNYIANNNIGILLHVSHDLIYHNNFINNTNQVEDICWTNPWLPSSATILDDGYPSGGNYWSDYEDRYPNATELDDSGIWDTPYIIDTNNQDNYPLMNPWFPPPTPEPQPSESFPTWIAATTVIVAIAVVGAAFLVYFTKVRKKTEKVK